MHLLLSTCRWPDADPLALLANGSALLGPARPLRRRPAGPVRLAASWPADIPPKAQALVLGADLRRLAETEGPLEEFPVQPVEPELRRRLADWTFCSGGFREVPSHGPSWEFVVETRKRRPRTLQIRVESRFPGTLSLTTFITNWTADDRLTQRAASSVMLVLNGRLRWTRLCLRDGVFEAEVTLPVDAISRRLWDLARTALEQSAPLRETLRIIQVSAVGREYERIHGCRADEQQKEKENGWDEHDRRSRERPYRRSGGRPAPAAR